MYVYAESGLLNEDDLKALVCGMGYFCLYRSNFLWYSLS